MIKFQEIKIGDYVDAEYEGQMCQGQVTGIQHDQHLVHVLTDVQEFWFDPEHLFPIPLNAHALVKLKFKAEVNEDGSVKYSKGAFRLVSPSVRDFSHFEMWYREDKRHNPDVKYVHQLQHQYLDMTKVHLTMEMS